MSVRPIVIYPSKILRMKCKPVTVEASESLLQMMEDMEDTLEESDRGAALAANQIGLDVQMFATNQFMTGRDNDETVRNIPPFVMNPRIVRKSSETEMLDEACLSFPGFGMKVRRHRTVEIVYDTLLKIDGEWSYHTYDVTYSGFWGQVFQHEIDHLNGKLFVDALPEKKRIDIANYITKQRKK